jgi:uncharacterized membrane protein
VSAALPRADRALRVVRGCLLAGTSTALTVATHCAAGGGVPDLGLFLLPTVLLSSAGTMVAERVRARGVMVAILGGTQLAVHCLLSMNATSHEMLLGGHAMAGPVPMALGHVVATLLLAVVLSRVDAVLTALAAAVSAALPVRPLVPPAWAPTGVCIAVGHTSGETMVMLRRIRSRRGPPCDS